MDVNDWRQLILILCVFSSCNTCSTAEDADRAADELEEIHETLKKKCTEEKRHVE